MNTPTISLIASSIHSEYWGKFYHSLRTNHFPIEVVFVGAAKKIHHMPNNFRYIFTKVKPTQCVEIAARAATGTYLMVVADDLIFSREAIDKIIFWIKRLGRMSIVGCRYSRSRAGEGELNRQACLLPWEPFAPVTPICGTIRKEDWHELGGIDRDFIAVCGDTDLHLRAVVQGGHPFISPDSVVYERPVGDSLARKRLSKVYRRDHIRLADLWTNMDEDGKTVIFRKTRKIPAKAFWAKGLRQVSQGPPGQWK